MKKILILGIIIVLFGTGALVWWNRGNSALNKQDTTEKIFVIEKGSTVREIGNKLATEGLIRDPVAFFITLKLQGKDRGIQAGSYRLSPSMTLPEVIDNLEHGTLDVWVTIPEGIRSDEIAEILEETFVTYEESWNVQLKAYEGYLFPDTYLIPQEADIDRIISILNGTFNQKVQEVGLSPDDPGFENIVIMASMIEREALFDDDQYNIASVMYNRLEEGMPLQIDATVQYALGYSEEEQRWWKKNLTLDDLQIDSPFNTYKNVGLPPRPISNPGLNSIQAAMDPSQTDYLYYLHDSEGRSHFGRTLNEHNNNIEKYLSN